MLTPGSASTIFKSPSKKAPVKGLFADGIWHCNCSPRKPASHFQVKKEGPNKGRWFYTCQDPKEVGCGFFLWGEEAAGREMQAVINNTHSELEALQTPSKDLTAEGDAAPSHQTIASLEHNDQDEFGEWPFSQEDGRKVFAVADTASLLPGANPGTPRKAVKSSMLCTPGFKRKREEETLPTPITEGKSIGRLAARQDDDVFGTPTSIVKLEFGIRSPSITPTPNHVQVRPEPLEPLPDSKPSSYDISDEVLELLKDQDIDEETTTNLRHLLNKHGLRISGIAKGRDITRLALKAKDVKIAELQQKIAGLEAEREMDKTIIRHFKSDMADSVAKRGRGRGRGRS